jgi:hypothetical protein
MLQFAGVWWAFVFPLVFFWDALAAWLIVVVAGLLLGSRALLLTPANRDTGRA